MEVSKRMSLWRCHKVFQHRVLPGGSWGRLWRWGGGGGGGGGGVGWRNWRRAAAAHHNDWRGGQLTRWWFKWVPMNWGVGACKNVVLYLYPFRISTPGLRTSKKGIFQRTKHIIKHLRPESELAPRMPPVAASASDGKAKGILGTKMKGACAIF